MVTENQNTHNGKIESYQTSLKRKHVPEKIESYDTQLQRPTVENTVVDMDELEMMLNAPDRTMYNPRFTRMLSNLKVYMPCKNNGYRMSQYLIIGNSDFFEDANVSYWDCYLDKSEYVGPHKMLQVSLKSIFFSLKQEKRLIDGILLHMHGQMWLIKAEEFSIPGERVVVQQGVYKLKKYLKPMAEELQKYTPHLHDALLVNDNHSEGVMIADCQAKEDYYALAKSIERVLGKNDIFKGLPFKIYPSKSQIGRVVLERGECIF